jgi:hypothetical protein
VIEPALALAIAQDAEILRVDAERNDLDGFDGAGAVLRF